MRSYWLDFQEYKRSKALRNTFLQLVCNFLEEAQQVARSLWLPAILLHSLQKNKTKNINCCLLYIPYWVHEKLRLEQCAYEDKLLRSASVNIKHKYKEKYSANVNQTTM